MTLRTLNYGNYGILLIMGNAGFCPSTVLLYILACVDPDPETSKPRPKSKTQSPGNDTQKLKALNPPKNPKP